METASTNKSNARLGYSYIVCRNRGDETYFDNNQLSKNGKKISLSKNDGKPQECPNWSFHGSRSVNTGPSEPISYPIRIDITELILAKILRIVKRFEKYIVKSAPGSDSAYDPTGGCRQ